MIAARLGTEQAQQLQTDFLAFDAGFFAEKLVSRLGHETNLRYVAVIGLYLGKIANTTAYKLYPRPINVKSDWGLCRNFF